MNDLSQKSKKIEWKSFANGAIAFACLFFPFAGYCKNSTELIPITADAPRAASLNFFYVTKNSTQYGITSGTPISFDATQLPGNTVIFYNGDGSFSITKSGYYLVSFVGQSNSGLGIGRLAYNLNGSVINMPTGIIPPSTSTTPTNCVMNSTIKVPSKPTTSIFKVVGASDSAPFNLTGATIQFIFVADL